MMNARDLEHFGTLWTIVDKAVCRKQALNDAKLKKPPGDADMLRIMAAENDDLYDMSPGVINETVLAVQEFFLTHPEEKPLVDVDQKYSRSVKEIAESLAWSQRRVRTPRQSAWLGPRLGSCETMEILEF